MSAEERQALAEQAATCIRMYYGAQAMMVRQRDELARLTPILVASLGKDEEIQTSQGCLRRKARAKPKRTVNAEALMLHYEDLPVDLRAKIIHEEAAVVFTSKLPAEIRETVKTSAEKVDIAHKWPTVADIERMISLERREVFLNTPTPPPDEIVIDEGDGILLGVE